MQSPSVGVPGGCLEELNGWVKVSWAAEAGRALLGDVRAGAKPGDLRQPTVLHKGPALRGPAPCLQVESHTQTTRDFFFFLSQRSSAAGSELGRCCYLYS